MTSRDPLPYRNGPAYMIQRPSDRLPLRLLDNAKTPRANDTPALRAMREAIQERHGQKRLPLEQKAYGA